MTKVRVTKEEMARAMNEWVLHDHPEFIELEGEVVYEGATKQEAVKKLWEGISGKTLPPLPEEIKCLEKSPLNEPYNMHYIRSTLNDIIRYLKARE